MPDSLTHAGGVVFRRRDTATEYLLVAAKNAPDEWVLPKGHIDRDEAPDAAARREVAEETGIDARLIGRIPGRVNFAAVHDGAPEVVRAVFYLMEYVGDAETDPETGAGPDTGTASENRALRWLLLDDARAALTFPESRDVLVRAEELRVLSQQAR